MANVYQVSLSFVSGRSNFWQMVLHYQLDEVGGHTPFDYADALNTAFIAGVGPQLQNCLSNDTTWNIISTKRVTGGGGPSMLQQPGLVGLFASPSYAGPNAVDIRMFPGGLRSRLGRLYLGGIPTAGVVGDVIQPAYLVPLNAFAGTLLTALTLAGGRGQAEYGTFSRSTQAFHTAVFNNISPKLAGLNKRSVPLI